MGSFDLKFKTPNAPCFSHGHTTHTRLFTTRDAARPGAPRAAATHPVLKNPKNLEKAYLSPQVLLVIKNN